MLLDHRLGQRQPEPGALIFACEGALDLAEFGQGGFDLFGRDSDSIPLAARI